MASSRAGFQPLLEYGADTQDETKEAVEVQLAVTPNIRRTPSTKLMAPRELNADLTAPRGNAAPFGDAPLAKELDAIMAILVNPDTAGMDRENLLDLLRDEVEHDDWEKLSIEMEFFKLFELAEKLTLIYDAPMPSICPCDENECVLRCVSVTDEVDKPCCVEDCNSHHGEYAFIYSKCETVVCASCATVMKLVQAIQAQTQESLGRRGTDSDEAEVFAPVQQRDSIRQHSSVGSGHGVLDGLKHALGSSIQDERRDGTDFKEWWRLMQQFMKREDDIRREFTDEEDWPNWMRVPDIVKYTNLNVYGWIPSARSDLARSTTWDLWHYCMDELNIKNRQEYWNVLEFLSRELNTARYALDESLHTLVAYHVDNVYQLCLGVTMSSVNAMATALYYAAFMSQKAEEQPNRAEDFTDASLQLIELAKKMLVTIDSDHLAMFLLELPTDLGGQECLSPIDIALANKMDEFLDDQRIQRVGQRLWTDFYKLDPKNQFLTSKLTMHELFWRLLKEPAGFYFTPMGQFIVNTLLYIIYVGLFSFVTFQQHYDFTKLGDIDYMFWCVNGGFVLYEFIEAMLNGKDYFKELTNYWDFLLSCIFVSLFVMRVERSEQNLSGLTDVQLRNSAQTEVYMALWGFACICLWSRLALLLRRSAAFGPFLQMVFNMVKDISVFTMIAMLFFTGFAFAVWYVAGKDVAMLPGVHMVAFYIFQTLNSQQDWTIWDITSPGNTINKTRSTMALALIGLFTVFATIMLLNLLIAMMATTYDTVRERSRKESNFAEIETAYYTERGTSLISAPLNIFAIAFGLAFFALDMLVWVFTGFNYQLNEEWWSPVAWDTYNIRDHVEYEVRTDSMSSTVESITSEDGKLMTFETRRGQIVDVLDTDGYCVEPPIPRYQHTRLNCSLPRNDVVVKDFASNTIANVSEFSIVKVHKQFFRQVESVPQLEKEAQSWCNPMSHIPKEHCPYCYYRIGHRDGNLKKFFHTFRSLSLRLDESDTLYLEHILSKTNEFGDTINYTHGICPNCYRPFRYLPEIGLTDRITRYQYVLEIVSFWVFMTFVYCILVIMFAIPAFVSYILTSINATSQLDHTKFNRIESQNEFRQVVKDQMPRSEDIGDQMDKVFAKFKRVEAIVNRESMRTKDQFDEQRKSIRFTHTDVKALHQVMKQLEVLTDRVADKSNIHTLLDRHHAVGEHVQAVDDKLVLVEGLMERLQGQVDTVQNMVEEQAELRNKMDYLFKAVEKVEHSVVEHSGELQLAMLSEHVTTLESRVVEVRDTTGSLGDRVTRQETVNELTSKQLQEQWKQMRAQTSAETEKMKSVLEKQARSQEQALESTQMMFDDVRRSSEEIMRVLEREKPDSAVGVVATIPETEEKVAAVTSDVSEHDIEWNVLVDPALSFRYGAQWMFEKIRVTDLSDMDHSGNNRVDFDEFKRYFNDIDPIILRVIFNQADKNGDGDMTSLEYYRWRDKRLSLKLITSIIEDCVPKTIAILKNQLAECNHMLVELQQSRSE